jgi:ribosomal protein L6P/L9E
MPKKFPGTKEFLIAKEIFLKKEGALTRKGKLLTYNNMDPYLKYYFTIKNTLRQTYSQNLNYLKTKLKPSLIGLSVKYKKVLNILGGGYKFILVDRTLILELGYSHKILLV